MASLDSVPAGSRHQHLELLKLADDASDHIEANVDEGELFTWRPEGSSEVIGAIQAVPWNDAVWELTLVAVERDHQGNGHGTAMIRAVVERLQQSGARRVLVGTASAGTGQLGFYQRAGFRMVAIERDHFDRARGYDGSETENGIPIRDLVWLDQLLG